MGTLLHRFAFIRILLFGSSIVRCYGNRGLICASVFGSLVQQKPLGCSQKPREKSHGQGCVRSLHQNSKQCGDTFLLPMITSLLSVGFCLLKKISSPSSIPWIAYHGSFREQVRTSKENVKTLLLVWPLPQLASSSRGPLVLVSDRLMSQIKSPCLWLFYSSVFSLRRIHGTPLWIRNKDNTDYTNLSLTYMSHHHGEKTDILNDPRAQCGEGCPKLFVLWSQCAGEVEGSIDANTNERITVFG